MKRFTNIILLFCLMNFLTSSSLLAQVLVSSRIVNAEGNGVANVNISLLYGKRNAATDKNGYFELFSALQLDTLIVNHSAYETYKAGVSDLKVLPQEIVLRSRLHLMEEVLVSTGYYQMPKERATGSFSHVGSELLNRTSGATILDRLEGVVEGMQFNRDAVVDEGKKKAALRVRGVATIESNESPLIVLDNFPYEGEIETINPDDVESVTVLKDAAAASIWGARAGNGVVVITTKKGQYNKKASITFNTTHTMGGKPDLFYSKDFLPSPTVLAIEEERFARGGYTEDLTTVLPNFVESLILHRDGSLSDSDLALLKARLSTYDVRQEALKYLYQNSYDQQQSLNINGGGERHRYLVSGGYRDMRETIVGNKSNRLNLNMENTYTVLPGMELSAGIRYTVQNIQNNGLALTNLDPSTGPISPYQRLMSDEGEPLAVPYRLRSLYVDNPVRAGLLDWSFIPLNEQEQVENKTNSNELILRSQLNYRFFSGFSAELNYQYITSKTRSHSYNSPDSYYTRDLVNKFTQSNGTRIIPEGGIMYVPNHSGNVGQSGRFLLKYNGVVADHHEVNALAGYEVREEVFKSNAGYALYNYKPDIMIGTAQFNYGTSYPVLPVGNMMIPSPSGRMTKKHRPLSRLLWKCFVYVQRTLYAFRKLTMGWVKSIGRENESKRCAIVVGRS